MKALLILFSLTLSVPALAESDYVVKMKAVFSKMLEAKKIKESTIRGSKGQPDLQRWNTIRNALEDYKDAMIPLMEESDRLEASYSKRISKSDEALIASERKRVSAILHDESAMDQASSEVDMTAGQ